MPRRSHEEVSELIEARKADFVNSDTNVLVLRASLRALGLDVDEINFEVSRATAEFVKRHLDATDRMKPSKAWLAKYLKENRR